MLNSLVRQQRNLSNFSSLPSAGHRLVSTYELLENILHFLDAPALRRAHLVNTFWHDVIHRSPTLEARAKKSRPHRLHTSIFGGVRSGAIYDFTHMLIGVYADVYDPTFSPDFRKVLDVDGYQWLVQADISTCAEGAEYPALEGQFLRQNDTFMLVYMTGSRESFNSVQAWATRWQTESGATATPVRVQHGSRRDDAPYKGCLPGALIGVNHSLHSTQPTPQTVPSSEGAAFARKLGCPFIEGSAYPNGGCVDRALTEVCRARRQQQLADLSKRPGLLKARSASEPVASKQRSKWRKWYQAGKKIALVLPKRNAEAPNKGFFKRRIGFFYGTRYSGQAVV